MERKIFALKGVGNVGKTQTIKKAYELIIDKYPNAKQELVINGPGIEIRSIITIKGVKIGIESQGDPNSRLVESIDLFVKEKCRVIICATRTSGATVEAVKKLQPDYKVVWFERPVINDVSDRNQSNQDMVNKLVSETERLIKLK